MNRREIIMIIIACLLIIAQVYLDLKIPDYINQITVLTSSMSPDVQTIFPIGIGMLSCLVGSLILSIIISYLSARAASGFTFTLRKKLFNKVMRFSENEVNNISIPSLITRTTNDITQIQILIAMGLQIIIKSPIMAIWAITKILGKNWQQSLLTAFFIVAVAIAVFMVMFAVLPKFRKIQKYTDRINTVVRENIVGINVVHAFNAQDYQINKFAKINKGITSAQLFIQRSFSFLIPVIELATSGLWFSIYWLGAALLIPMDQASRLAFFGDIVAFAMYASYILASFMMMTFIFMMWPPAQASGERINEVFETQISLKYPKEKKDSLEKINTDKILELKDVFFKYPDSKHDMLKNINFDVKKGETLAIIGSTGSGKSTLANILMRFYDINNGQIFIKGRNIKDYSEDELYDTIYLATQKPIIFYGSVKDNILFGQNKTNINDESIKEALSISQCDDFVYDLKNGLDTVISQSGKDISGGQKQRLSIARAIIKKPEILILDDTFSALDYKTDAMLRKDLNEKLKDTSVIIIAQRIGTIKNADKILVLDNGKIVGSGNHEYLLQNCDEYKQIYSSQIKSIDEGQANEQ